jgi:hypothetical protein
MSVPMNYPLACSYENCNVILRDSNHASKHRHEYHAAPGPVMIGGVLYNVMWDGKHIRCPVPDCKCVYTTRSSFKKHVDSSTRESISVYLPALISRSWHYHFFADAQAPSSPQGEVNPAPHNGKLLLILHLHPSLNHLLSQGTSTAVTSHDRPTGSAHGMYFSMFDSIELTLCASCQRSWLFTRGTAPS